MVIRIFGESHAPEIGVAELQAFLDRRAPGNGQGGMSTPRKEPDKVAYDILKRLADTPRRTAELRAALGIASVNFFTARYLPPLAKSGYIAVARGEKNRYLPGKQYRILRKEKAVICA